MVKALGLLKEYSEYVKMLQRNQNEDVHMSHFNNNIDQGNNLAGAVQGNQQNVQMGEYFITIQSIEGPSEMEHQIYETGAKIGKHSSNQIVIFDDSVSRFHARILFSDQEFRLKDIGSQSGTFLKISEKLELKVGMIIEIGGYQLEVRAIVIDPESTEGEGLMGNFVEFRVYESPAEENREKVFKMGNRHSIGRKSTNQIHFNEDLHMSNLHCKVILIGQKFYLEDIASTNGSWLRLSKKGIESLPFALEQGTIFKIGNSAMY